MIFLYDHREKGERSIKGMRAFLLVMVFLHFPLIVYGQQTGPLPPSPATGLVNPLGKTTSLADFIIEVLKVVRNVGFLLGVVAICYTGVLMVLARGNEDQLKKAKIGLFSSLGGTAVILAAPLIAEIIKNTIDKL